MPTGGINPATYTPPTATFHFPPPHTPAPPGPPLGWSCVVQMDGKHACTIMHFYIGNQSVAC